MQILKGIPASKGISIGPGLIYQPSLPPPTTVTVDDAQQEYLRTLDACQKAKADLDVVYQTAMQSVGQESAEIFMAQRMMLDDPELLETVEQKILTEHINADAAFYAAAEGYAQALEALSDEYLRARAADIRDVTRRVVRILQNKPVYGAQLARPTVILADDLAPSDTMQFNRAFILGFFTAGGGTTSHTAILSKALGVPAVVGGGKVPDSLTETTTLILDGDAGLLIIDPDEATLAEYSRRQQELANAARQEALSALQPALTRDHHPLEIAANIGNLSDAINAIKIGAEGVGLLRTEFSYIEHNAVPAEEDLVRTYSAIFHTFGEYPVVVRTLDIGGDKEMPHLKLPVESNPFLGVRGIRLCLVRPDLFRPQLRAILRAGVNVNLRIMFPMVAVASEVRQARAILGECMDELERENLPYHHTPQVGIMIEVPSAALCADQLAKEVDFFSIGTNDLTQYTLAVDRTNSDLSHLVSALQPAVLRLIQRVIEAGHAAGIWVGMCGEMAGEPLAIPILIGMGLDEFSMNPPAIPRAKEIIRRWDTGSARVLAERAVQCETPEQVEDIVKNWSL
jgi:phosphoenolpyruvate-protein phosphotransferase